MKFSPGWNGNYHVHVSDGELTLFPSGGGERVSRSVVEVRAGDRLRHRTRERRSWQDPSQPLARVGCEEWAESVDGSDSHHRSPYKSGTSDTRTGHHMIRVVPGGLAPVVAAFLPGLRSKLSHYCVPCKVIRDVPSAPVGTFHQ